MNGRNKRLFVSRGRLPWVGILVTATLITLAACAPRSENWSTAESTKRLRVDRAQFHHTIRFPGNRADLTQSESKVLDRFLDRQAKGQGIRIWIAGGDTLIDVRRQASVLTYLRKRGLTGKLDTGATGTALASGSVRLTLVRSVVTLPGCGDWSKDPATDRSNLPSSNFGCATASNLGLMVADPSVLVRGTDLGPGDGDALGRGVRKYRVGTSKKTPNITTQSIKSAGGDK